MVQPIAAHRFPLSPHSWSLRAKAQTALILIGALPATLILLLEHASPWIILGVATLVVVITRGLMPWVMQPLTTLQNTISRVQAGDLTARATMAHRDALGAIATAFDAVTIQSEASINDVVDQKAGLEREISKLFQELGEPLNGNLTVLPSVRDGILGTVANAVSALITRLKTTVSETQDVATTIDEATIEGLTTIRTLAAGVEEQVQSVVQGINTVDSLALSTTEIQQSAQTAMTVSSQVLEKIHNGHTSMAGARETMGTIRDTTQRATRHVKSLGESAQLMRQALTLVQRNTEELHIIAGNASIEAARHADSGGIFRGVADSIEALAEESQLALRQIQDVVERNHYETIHVVESIENVTTRVAAGAHIVQTATDTFQNVDHLVEELATLNTFIANTTTVQAEQSSQLGVIMAKLGDLSAQTSFHTQDAGKAAEQAHSLATQLRTYLSTFKVR